MSDNLLGQLHPALQPFARALVAVARAHGLRVVVTSAYRDPAKQARLYARYKAGLSPYPAAAPGKSTHEQRLAFDIKLSDPRYYASLGQLWESVDRRFRWGGRFNDPIHFDVKL